jgi:S-formylglutathione hydrolase FrmB
VSGWFAISTDKPTQHKFSGGDGAVGLGGRDAQGMPGDQTEAANTLCGLGRSNGITCSVVPTTGRHDWPLATQVFTAAVPWLFGAVHTPGVAAVPLPAGSPVPAVAGPAPAAAPAPLAPAGR